MKSTYNAAMKEGSHHLFAACLDIDPDNQAFKLMVLKQR
jgi:hypothetical protein